MASLGDDSIASVNIHNLNFVREQLLQHSEPSAGANDARPMSEHQAVRDPAIERPATPERAIEDNGDGIGGRDDLSAEVPDSARRTPAHHHSELSQNETPRSPAKMEGEADDEPQVHATPSQEAFRNLTRADSYNDEYPGGDTQPMESQIYRTYSESMMKRSPERGANEEDGGRAGAGGETEGPNTYQEGDTGFVDLANAWPEDSMGRSQYDEDLLHRSPETQNQLPGVEGGQVFPETPGLVGQKHDRDGALLTSSTVATKKTPGYSQLFGGTTGMPGFTATQMFNQTQDPSSPAPEVPFSDPIVTRPSPNINNQHANLSSPSIAMSSPFAAMNGRPSSMATGPRDDYTTVLESQQKRAARLRQEHGIDSRFGENIPEEDEDDDDDIVRRQHERKRLRRNWSDQEVRQMQQLTAPPRPGSRQKSSSATTGPIDLVTPATARRSEKVQFSISDDEQEEEQPEEDDGEMPLNEDEENNNADQDDDADVYDEFAQEVLRSQAGPEDEGETESEDEGPDADEGYEGDDVEKIAGSPEPDSSRQKDLDTERVITNTQPSAVADSQPHQPSQGRQGTQKNAPPHSSIASYIPGSQYAGKTSQDQALLISTGARLSASQPAGASTDKTPSSPPLPARIPQSQGAVQETAQNDVTETTVGQEIPESDLPDTDTTGPESKHSVEPQETDGQVESNNHFYSTARTHNSASGPSPNKPIPSLESQRSGLASPSPREAGGIRRFADIAAVPTPVASQGAFDLDAVMGNVMGDDQAYFEAMNGSPEEQEQPPTRRRRTRNPSPEKSPKMAGLGIEIEKADPQPESQKENSAAQAQAAAEEREQADEVNERPAKRTRHTLASVSELPKSTPENKEAPETPQDSATKRESAGANAVSKLLSTRASRRSEPLQQRAGRKGAAKKEEPARPGKLRRNMKEKSSVGTPKPTPAKPTKKRGAAKEVSEEPSEPPAPVEEPDVSPAAEAVEETIEETEISAGVEPMEEDTEESNEPLAVTAPNRVLALFKGSYNNFYPATWISSSADGSTQKVKFDDTTVTDIDTYQVRRLELKVGDPIKVDGTGMRNKNWTVQSLGPVAKTDEDRSLGTDIYGHVLAKVRVKLNRQSLSAKKKEDKVIEVMITNTYITHTMWPQFADRVFEPPNQGGKTSRADTPTTGAETPIGQSPGSRTRRSYAAPTAILPNRASHLREDSVASAETKPNVGLFAGMAFAISYGSNENEKAQVTSLIKRNGGAILENGFEEMFDLPALDEAGSNSPPKKNSKKPEAFTDLSSLELKSEYEGYGFVALIADTFSRRAKYMQALALGLPTLSGKWIRDSLDAAKKSTHSTTLPWSRYLLPAGESATLGGAVRSRTMSNHDAPDPRLVDSIANRDKLLAGDGVLIVAPKKGKTTWNRRKAYAFLTLALGAGCVRRVNDLAEAKKCIDKEGERWRWVYVDGVVGEACTTLFGKKKAVGGGKRKRDEDGDGGKNFVVGEGGVKVVNDEFVVQSLILGALVG